MTKRDEDYPLNAASISDGELFCREDFIGQDVVLTMKAAAEGKGPIKREIVTNPWDFKQAPKSVLHFEETNRRLVLNTGNRKRLQRMFGNKTRTWCGKKITLRYDPKVKAAKGNTPGGIVIVEDNKQ